ncbi:hypothetical protein N9948_02115 [bacterium]|nr:hypothetical protein [bacterium]
MNLLKVTCQTPKDYKDAQKKFRKLGFDWRAAWKGFNMQFSQNVQYLYLKNDKTFGWDSYESCHKGTPSSTASEYTSSLYAKFFSS